MHAIILLFIVLFVSPLCSEIHSEIAISCGESETINVNDIIYLGDHKYDSISGYGYNKINKDILYDTIQVSPLGDNYKKRFLFRKSIFGVDEYKIDLENGEYFLSLYLYEPLYQATNRRVFSIYAEEENIYDSLDIVKEVGTAKTFSINRKITVTDNVLNLTFDSHIGKSVLSAIKCVKKRDISEIILPKKIDVIPSYYANIIFIPEDLDSNIAYTNIYRKIDNEYKLIRSKILVNTFIDYFTTGDSSSYRFSFTDYNDKEYFIESEIKVAHINPNSSDFPVYNIKIDTNSLARILDNKYAGDYYPATFYYKGKSYEANLRLRGVTSRKFHKKSWKVKFDDDNKCEGKEKLNFLSLVSDATLIRESMFRNVMKDYTTLDLEHYYANLFINDQYMGLYLMKEQEDNEFLEKNQIQNAAVYKGNYNNTSPLKDMEDYYSVFEVQNNYEGGFSILDEFLTFVDTASIKTLEQTLEKKFYVYDFVRTRAVINYLADKDQCNHNYILIYNLDEKKWRFITYDNSYSQYYSDTDILYYSSDYPDNHGCWFNLFDKILKVPKYKYLFWYTVERLVNYTCNIENSIQKLDSLYLTIKDEAYKDYSKGTHADYQRFENEVGYLKQFYINRNSFVREILDSVGTLEIPDGISINEIMTNNVSALETVEGKYHNWIEFYNNVDVPIDLVNFKLKVEQNGRNNVYHFPVNTVIEPYSCRVFLFEEGNDDEKKYINGKITPDKANLTLIRKTDGKIEDELNLIGLPANNSYAELDNTSGQWMMFTLNTYNSSNIGMDKYVKIFINEFMAKNDSTLADEWGEYEDWIELYNPNNLDIDLSGYYLSDELEETDKWRIPNGTYIPANGFLLFWADKDEEQGDNHIDFKLSGDSGYVMLTNPYNNLIIDSVYYIDADTDESFARNGDGMPEWIKAHVPTPNRSNIYYNENTRYNIMDVYPNPADLYINVYFVLHRNKWAKLRLCDFRGSTIRELYNGKYEAGEYSFRVDLSDLASGTYFLYFETKDHYEVKPFVKVE